MHKRSKKPVWVLFKLLEILVSSICCYIHVKCFQMNTIPHVFILCSTYGSGVIIGVLNLVATFFAERLTMKLEAMTSGLLGSLNLCTVFAHMYLAQYDKLVPFLKDREEAVDSFSMCCRKNACMALWAVAIYYMHCSFAFDMLLTHLPKDQRNSKDRLSTVVQKRSKNRLKLYFISKDVERYVSRFRWFRLLSTSAVTRFAKRSKASYVENIFRSEYIHNIDNI